MAHACIGQTGCGDDAYQRGSDTPTVASGGMEGGFFQNKTVYSTTAPNQSGYTVKADWNQVPGTQTLIWSGSRYDYTYSGTGFDSGGQVVIWTEDAADGNGVISVECYAGP